MRDIDSILHFDRPACIILDLRDLPGITFTDIGHCTCGDLAVLERDDSSQTVDYELVDGAVQAFCL